MGGWPRSNQAILRIVESCLVLSLAFLLPGCLPGLAGPNPLRPTGTATTVAPRPAVFPLAGTWTGTARNADFEMQATIILYNECQVGGKCGTFNLQNVPCSGSFTLLHVDGDVYEFQAGDKQGTCGEGRDLLRLLHDGRLQYISRGDYGSTLGNLVRADSPAAPASGAGLLPVLFDDDGSPDGTVALLYLLAEPGVSLQGVSVTYGEAHPQVYIQHLGRMLDDFGFTGIPLGEGQDAPLPGGNPFPEWMRQDANGFWSMPIPNADRTYPAQPAEQMIVSVLNAAPEPVTVFISGPCTSLALALRLDPGIKDHIKAVYIMGGAVHVPGNLGDVVPDPANSTAEWNIFADPQAAQLVLEAGLDLYLVPLDATNQVRVAPRDIQRWSEGGRIGGLAADFYSMLMKKTGLRDYAVWDGMTAAIMSDPALCGFELMSLQVGLERGPDLGRTMLVKAGAANVHVCLRPDVQAIKDRLAQRLGASR